MEEGGGAEPALPPGWSREYSNSQKRHFYFHKDTKHTQWHFPTASEVKDPLKAKKRAEMNKEKEKKRSSSNSHHHSSSSKRPKHSSSSQKRSSTSSSDKKASQDNDDFLELADATSVAIIVPFRDLHAAQKRAAHLSQFVPHMHEFFTKLKERGLVSDYHIYIVEQSNDERKFNRGKLLNIGFDMASKQHTKPDSKGRRNPPHDVFIFHDVDLLPADDLGSWYSKFPTKPLHIARVWDRYSNNPKYFGGIVSFSKSDYKRINGYPNTFWGWGGEDDEMQNRLERLGIQFESPPSGNIRDLEDMTLKEKLDFLRENREWKCMVKWEALEEHEATWKTNGINNLNYKVLKITQIDDSSRASRITADVLLNPNNHWANVKCGVDFTG
mmetsp:Transcript_2610/g.3483  ORF Transcript_2610/g.3483 Transcript_2610/m.3483 type:complete len:384 (-) Transcript_2610:369-1520(-)|eukprot:CAMPEP_0198153718 /NCGR_PEP_ID=MMETSP1443-20131203/65422_1 /TAXON_ID=186043 /ORGANISM="Entomoneis sp., Strain CCMP2396" /LENGTH=383 /DNA_ID=CAMNT_0043820153 /DNA_START=95 /DNA_END=1246 /DNA_ORIENTATION=-